ncbi:MAG: ATP-dependent DNA ligase [Myxococcota bacterium]
MLLADLVAASRAVSATRSRLKKIEALARCVGEMRDSERRLGVSYLAGVLPQGKIGLGYSTLSKNKPSTAANEPELQLLEVDRALTALKELKGAGSNKRRAADWVALLERATEAEQRFLSHLVVGELRQGALEGIVVEAVAKAAEVSAAVLRRAVMLGGSLPYASEVALKDGEPALAEFRVELFRPVQPMLAQAAASPSDVFSDRDRAFFEYKLDGARVQIHREGDDVRIFSRRLNDVTAALPEVVDFARSLGSRSIVLDGEVLAMRSDGRPHPFQTTMRRFGRRSSALRSSLPLSTSIFDVLHIDGEDVLDAPLETRLDIMASQIPSHNRAPGLVTSEVGEADGLFERALSEGHEGLMAKDLNSTYEAGSRGAGWLKLKLAHTLDLVVLAAEWGSGRRRGWLSNLHLGALDPSDGGFVMLGKTFKGLTDDMLAWQTEKLLSLETSRDQYTVYVKPELVVEIAISNVQESPQYPAGLALRFARVKSFREDKQAADSNTVEEVRAIHRRDVEGHESEA